MELNMHKVSFSFESNEIAWNNKDLQQEKIYSENGWIINELMIKTIVSTSMIELYIQNNTEFWNYALVQAEQWNNSQTSPLDLVMVYTSKNDRKRTFNDK